MLYSALSDVLHRTSVELRCGLIQCSFLLSVLSITNNPVLVSPLSVHSFQILPISVQSLHITGTLMKRKPRRVVGSFWFQQSSYSEAVLNLLHVTYCYSYTTSLPIYCHSYITFLPIMSYMHYLTDLIFTRRGVDCSFQLQFIIKKKKVGN